MKKKIGFVTILAALLVIFSIGLSYGADEKKNDKTVTLIPIYWQESNNGTYLTQYSTLLHGDEFHIRYDFLDLPKAGTNIKRIRLHAGKFDLLREKNAKATFRPGIILDNKDRIYYGGKVLLTFPKLGLSIEQKSYGGNKADRHQTFANLNIYKPVSVMYYQLASKGSRPTVAIGPRVNVGKFGWVYYGWQPNRKNAGILCILGKVKF